MFQFKPEVTEQEWFSTPPPDLDAMWRSLPHQPRRTPAGGWMEGRKKLLLVVALFRRVADLLTDLRCLNVLAVAERHADGQSTDEELSTTHKHVDFVFDNVHQPSRAAGRAVEAARALISSASDAASILDDVVGLRAALLTGDETNRVAYDTGLRTYRVLTAHLMRDIFGNPFRPVTFSPSWRTDAAVSLARAMYNSRDFSTMPILADALQDAGCDNADLLAHCRDPKQTHVRGCWVVDLVLGKE